ncbi:MAG: CotH kinase family protein [Bacteroidales bacterium]|nr:CotH kinase family protein [Bacteroidales bacterium]
MKKIILTFAVLVTCKFAYAQDSPADHYEAVILAADLWRFFPGTSDPGFNWNDTAFIDSLWGQGAGGIGYGDNDDNTVIDPVVSLFMRIEFTIRDTSAICDALFYIDYDDGFIAYINGNEIAREGITGNPPAYNAYAENHDVEGTPSGFPFDKSVLVNGKNLLAIQVHNSSATSSDLSSIPYFIAGIGDTTRYYRPVPQWFKEPFVFKESNLPVFIIETENGTAITDEPKTNANLRIINNVSGLNNVNDAGTDYDSHIGIELRGSYSQSLPQKPYGFETRDTTGENFNVSLLGMPEENDWILLANYNDKTFLRNSLSFHLFNKMGHYAPRSRLCEVLMNGSYDGVYLFTEKIKRDDNRVDVAKLDIDDNAGDSLTGGYIFKVDYFSATDSWLGSYSPVDYPGAQVHYVYHDPKPEELTSQQKNYIQDYVYAFETVLYSPAFKDINSGYRKYIDVPSFVDYFIIGELSRNVDAYKKSRFFHKHHVKKGGKIHSGPVWDFDWAWLYLEDGCPHFGATDGSGWAYRIDECNPWPSPSGWEVRLMQDERFVKEVYDRYIELRGTILSKEYIHNYIDSVALLVSEAQERHYNRWDILGLDVGAPEHDPIPGTYQGEIQRLKEWIDLRLNWLDANMPGKDIIMSSETLACSASENLLRIFPNPAKDYFYIEAGNDARMLEIFNINGTLIKTFQLYSPGPTKVNCEQFCPGLYLVKTTFGDGTTASDKLMIGDK